MTIKKIPGIARIPINEFPIYKDPLYMYKLLLLADNACLLGFIYYMYTYYTYTTTPAVKCRSATIFATAAPFFYT